MDRIKINTNKISDISTSITRKSNDVKDVKSGFASVKGNIDYRIINRRNLSYRLASARNSLNEIEKDLRHLGSFIETSSSLYAQTETTLEKLAKIKFPEGYKWELTKSITGGLAFLISSKLNLKLGDLKFEFDKVNERYYIKLIGGNPRDYERYRDLLIERFGGNPSLWKKGFYEQLLTKGVPLYDIDNRFKFNNSSVFRDNMRRFGTNLDNFGDYVRRLGDSRVKLFLRTAGDSIVGTVTDFNVFNFKGVANLSSKSLGIAGTAITVIEDFQDSYSKNGLDKKRFVTDLTVDVVTGATATAIGAAAGSLFLPPVGTIVGAAAGAVINFGINSKIFSGDKSLVDLVKDVANDPESAIEKVDQKIDEYSNKVEDKIGELSNSIGIKLDNIFG